MPKEEENNGNFEAFNNRVYLESARFTREVKSAIRGLLQAVFSFFEPRDQKTGKLQKFFERKKKIVKIR